MTDIRKTLYVKYSSTFKEHISKFDEKNIGYTLSKYKQQYLPILNKYSKDVRILELGCGRGLLLKFLKDNGYKNVLGIDVSVEQIEIADVQGLNVLQSDVLTFLSSTDENFDLIFALDLIEHFSKNELIELAKNVYNRLNNNGMFVFHTPNGLGINSNRLIYGDLTHLTILTPNSAEQLLRFAGFSQIKFYETGPYAKNINGFIRKIIWKMIKFGVNFIRFIETGGTEKILTQNFIGIAKKNKPYI